MTPIPERVDDPKDAVLWAVLHKMETIDESPSTRIAFGTGILYNAQFGLDRPLFMEELAQVREMLKLPKLEEPLPEKAEVRDSFDADSEVTMREI